MIEADLVKCVLGLGPNLYYNSPIEMCVVIFRTSKPVERQGKILFTNTVDAVTREQAQRFLTDDHIEQIVGVNRAFRDEANFACVAMVEEVLARDEKISIQLYVTAKPAAGPDGGRRTRIFQEPSWRSSKYRTPFDRF